MSEVLHAPESQDDRFNPNRGARQGKRRCALLVLAWVAALPAAAQIPDDSPIADALRRAEEAIRQIVAIPDEQRTFRNTIEAIDDLFARLDRDTSLVQFMAYVSTDADERARGRRAEEDYNNWVIGFYKRADLYRAVRAFADTEPKLEPDQAKLLHDILRDFRRNGMALPPEKREQLKQVQMELNRLGIEFEKNIRDDETVVPLTDDELDGMSEEFRKGLTKTAGVYLVGMDYPTFLPIMNLCENETTRKKVWIAYKRRGGRKNVRVLERILKLRAEQAHLLGYPNAAAYELEVRMARTPERVQAFYDKLRPLVRKKALKDWDEFVAAKRAHTHNPQATLHPWDYSFYEKYLLRTKYAVDSEKVREYFPFERVLDGLFTITQSLYGLEYVDVTDKAGELGLPVWHEDVQLFAVRDKASGKVLGHFYLDLFPRPNKYNHAAQWGLIQHKVWADGHEDKPLAALVCNFTKPTPEKPSLMTHDEVETFFHEFGHCLHTILSESRYAMLAGTSVARDFVEAPSQMFENWVWDADVLQTFAKHYKTGEPIPRELVEAMVRARYLGSGLKAEHQFYYGLVDYTFHTDEDGVLDTTKVALELYDEIELYDPVPETYYHAGFGHFVGYQAGYYGYMWSLVYAQDMFQRFKDLGMLNPKAGMYYRKKILARGSTMDELKMVEDYLGRPVSMKPFLEHLGLKVGDTP